MSDINMTGEVKEINLLDMMGGAVGERVSYELSKIMRNCKDLNTEPKKDTHAVHCVFHHTDRDARQLRDPRIGEE